MSGEGLPDRIRMLDRELADVDLQEAQGELDHETARRLRETYRGERAAAAAELAERHDAPQPRSGRRMIIGGTLLAVSFVLIVLAAVAALSDAPPVAPDGNDLSQVSNEAMLAVIEANPDNPQINAMRLALAERYFEDLDYSAALPQFQAVLDNEPSALEASEALGRMGWMVHASGESVIAERLLERALEANSGNTEASWFLGLVLLQTARPCEAADRLQSLMGDPSIPTDAADEVEAVAARAASECSP